MHRTGRASGAAAGLLRLRVSDGQSGGNPDLEPEKADTLTAGIVVRPPVRVGCWSGPAVVASTGTGSRSTTWSRSCPPRTPSPTASTPPSIPAYAANNYWCTLSAAIRPAGDRRRDRDQPESRHADDVRRRLRSSTGACRRARGISASAGTSGGSTVRACKPDPDVAGGEFAGTIGGFAGSYPEWKWLSNCATRGAISSSASLALRRLDGRQFPISLQDDDVVPHIGLLRPRRELHDR